MLQRTSVYTCYAGYHGVPFYYSIILYYQRYPRPYIPLRAKNLYRLRNDYVVCIQNSGFCQLWPRLHRVFRLRMCAPASSSPEYEP